MISKLTAIISFILFGCILSPSFGQDESNACLKAQSFHIVVVGSSTAAGSGPSSPDSAWVNRYRKFVQSINPANQITNLAIGGTNTYQIMPTWFVPPVGRPSPNPSNNITQAILLGADAVIVNMPSNDAASGYSANEQMFNFHTIVNSADSFGVPVFTCTTQPRNFGAGQVQVQLDVRDSIFSAFGAFAIDFWTGLADTNNLPSPLYDSGDGVHLNDAGHNILFNRVKDKNILSQLIVPSNTTDFALVEYDLVNPSICGDSLQLLQVFVTNLGPDSMLPVNVEIEVVNIDSGSIQLVSLSIPNGLLACALDTLQTLVNTYYGGNYKFSIYLNSIDSNAVNDTLIFYKNFSGHPEIEVFGDTACVMDSVLLSASVANMDTILWYNSASNPNVIAGGNTFSIAGLSSSTTYYAEGVRGNLFFRNSIFTREETNINFNGYMFDLISSSDLIIDSMQIKFQSTGTQIVEIYSKSGSHLGFEQNAAAWNLFITDTIVVDSSGYFVGVDMNSLNLVANDTSAYYVRLQNPSSLLSYRTVSNPITRTTPELMLVTGSGIGSVFGNSYFPRDMAFELFYHFGFNPSGDCSTGRIPVEALISSPQPDLGNDTAFCQQYFDITLNPGNFFSYIWSTGATTNAITLNSFYYPIGFNNFYVTVFDSLGCSAQDSITINYLLCSGLLELDAGLINVFPNPSSGVVYFENPNNYSAFNQYLIYDLSGKLIVQSIINDKCIDLSALKQSTYIVVLKNEVFFVKKKISIVH